MSYLVWNANPDNGYCVVTTLENVSDAYEIVQGKPRLDGFPSDAAFQMDPDFPKDVELADNIYNRESMVLVSSKVADLFRDAPQVELLPVSILNHKGRVASESYFVLSPTAVVDCIDQDASDIEWNDIDPELICSCFGLTLKDDQIDESLTLFRLKHMPHIILVKEDLAQQLEQSGATGLRFVPVDEFEL